jgi:Tub family
MITPPVSMSVDFFHPSSRHGAKSQRQSNQGISILLSTSDDDERSGVLPVGGGSTDAPVPPLVPRHDLEEEEEDDDDQGFAFLEGVEVDLDNRAAPSEPVHPLSRAKLNELLSRVEIDVYSSLTSSAKGDVVDGSVETRRHLRTRFATYQRRLEAFVSQCDYFAFDECMLDFWDEFFPHTAGIHYYDRHTPVPRISSLKKFLTTPCPKSIGVVQCEIERLKIMSRGKGVNVKGRLFPTYEYRLFIRNRPHHSSDGGIANVPTEPRRDTVLMVAKNRGRKHAEASVVAPPSASSRKGSNNYYLYLPQQIDVDDHFNEANDIDNPTKLNPNGASIDPVIVSSDSSSVLLGRLQSNFIGTEFQIFTPHHKKKDHGRHKSDVASLSHFSEDELDYDSGVSSDNTSSRRTRFGRLSRRRNTNATSGVPDHGSVNSELTPIPSESPPAASARSYRVKRTVSCPDLQQRAARPSRRAIAANNTPDVRKAQPPSLYEEEDGVITYTANLLGSRPRIMDVCIPRVTADGVPGKEWRSYLETSDEGVDEGRMLHCFRQIQQRATDLPDPTDPPLFPPVVADNVIHREREEPDRSVDRDAPTASPPEDFGLMTLQNRPPWWNVELGSFVLNFGGRVSVASVKNFQLCERTDHDRIMLQFGRIQGRHSFTMDFQHPLSAVQAFSIAISSLQSKISFG